MGFNKRPTCRSRKRWWDLGIVDVNIAFPSTHNPSWAVFFNPLSFYMDKVFYGIKGDIDLCLKLNSFLFLLFAENFGYALVGVEVPS